MLAEWSCSPLERFLTRGAVHTLHSRELKQQTEKDQNTFSIRFPAPRRGGKDREENKHEKHCGMVCLALPQHRSLCQLLSPGTACCPPIGVLWALDWIWWHLCPSVSIRAAATHPAQLSMPS